MCFGSIELQKGYWYIQGSAGHSTLNGICQIDINTSEDSAGGSLCSQVIFGHKNYQINYGCISTPYYAETNKIIYFRTWAESSFEITPISFKAMRIRHFE